MNHRGVKMGSINDIETGNNNRVTNSSSPPTATLTEPVRNIQTIRSGSNDFVTSFFDTMDHSPLSDEGISEGTNDAQSNANILKQIAENQFASPMECLGMYFRLSIRAPATSEFPVIEKVWLCLCRLDGGNGQLLSQSLRWGIDGFRSWVRKTFFYARMNNNFVCLIISIRKTCK